MKHKNRTLEKKRLVYCHDCKNHTKHDKNKNCVPCLRKRKREEERDRDFPY